VEHELFFAEEKGKIAITVCIVLLILRTRKPEMLCIYLCISIASYEH